MQIFVRGSFIPKRDHGIDLCRAPCRKISCHAGNQHQRDDACKEAGCVGAAKTIEQVRDDAASCQRNRHSDSNAGGDQQDDLAHDEPADIGSAGADGDADSDLVGAAADHVGHQSVDADGGEEDRKNPEEGGELCDQALVGNGARDLFIERSDTADGEGVVNAVHRLLHCVRDRVEVAVVANGKVAVTPGVLRVRDVVDVLRFLLQASERVHPHSRR